MYVIVTGACSNMQCKVKDYITRDRFNKKKETSSLYKVTMWLTKAYTGHCIHVTSNNTQILLGNCKKKKVEIGSDRFIKKISVYQEGIFKLGTEENNTSTIKVVSPK